MGWDVYKITSKTLILWKALNGEVDDLTCKLVRMVNS